MEANPDKIQAILEMTPPKNIKEVQSLNIRVASLNKFVSGEMDKCLPFFKTLKKASEWSNECHKVFKELKAYLASPSLFSLSKPKKELSLYLAVSPTAVSSTLIWEEDHARLPINYTSRVLRRIEERYPPMEKLALSLIMTTCKLRPYFQAYTMVI